MISAELRGDKYLVRFKGKKYQFNEYINKIMSLVEKSWNMEEKCWMIPKSSLQLLHIKFGENIQFLDEVQQSTDSHKLIITDYENMGINMKLNPYDYQKEAIKFGIDSLNSLIVYPCGSGKTPIGIGIYLEAIEREVIKGPGMIVVKASLKTQWMKEIEKFSDLKSAIIQTPSDISVNVKNRIKTRKAKLKKKELNKLEIKGLEAEIAELELEAIDVFKMQFNNLDLFIMNYETLRDPLIRTELHKRKVDFVFADEIHYIKNRQSKRSQSLYEFGNIKMKIGATATPVGKNPEDLFGIFKLINPTLFNSWNSFASMYIKYAGFGRISSFKNLDHLTKKISPYVIVKTKDEISSQLPELLVMQRYCDLSPNQLEMTNKILSELEELKEKEYAIRQTIHSEAQLMNNQDLRKLEAQILALQTFAQEIADSVRLLEESSSEMAKQYVCSGPNNKLEMLAELIEEILDSGEKVAIFSRYERMQGIITERIATIDKSIKIAYVSGKIKDKARHAEVYEKFRDNDEYKILLLTDAGAEGLNLSKCKYLIEYDLAESYAIQTQRHGRIERADSIHDNAFVYQLIANDSWDQVQQRIVEKKESYDSEIIKSLATKKDVL
jgi:SNF2 family DNA or RNA helicase